LGRAITTTESPLDARRLGDILGRRVSAVAVETSNPTILSHVYRLRLTYDDGDAAPATLFLKTRHLDRPAGVAVHGPREVEFYRSLAPETPDILVRCHDTHWDKASGDWHILLEDLQDTHASPSQWPVPPTLADCETIVRTLARFHAAWWDHPRLGTSIGTWANPTDLPQAQRRMTEAVARFADALGDRLAPGHIAFYERLIDRVEPLSSRYHSHRNMTVVHGDAHVWNCFLPKAGVAATPKLFDWDGWRLDYATDDLAYQMALHWYPDLRRSRERHLLDVYHAELTARGVAGYDRRALQDDYRLSVLWATMTPVWQHAGNIPSWIWWSHLARIHLAVDDLGCRELLG
jgi:thiamine kinase-like enzyme